MRLVPLVALLLTALPLRAASEWPRFRGPAANGSVSDDPRLPVRWSQTDNALWKTEVKGLGWSSPVVTGNRVFLTGVYSDQDNANEQPKAGLYLGQGRQEIPKGTHHWLTYCLDLESGKVLWQKEAKQGSPPVGRHPKSTYASETPATDGQRVFVLFGDVGLFAYDLGGQLLWSHPIEARKTIRVRFPVGASFTASPWAYNGKVFCLNESGETYVLTEGGKFNLEHTNSLDGLCLSTPAIADGKLLIRTSTQVYCLGAKDRK